MNWRFGVVGNIVGAHVDENGNTYYGTKAFKPNTKVYINGKNWDFSETEICVIGMNRFGRMVLETIPIARIEKIRTQRIYNPTVLQIMHYLSFAEGIVWWERTVADRKDSESFVKWINGKE